MTVFEIPCESAALAPFRRDLAPVLKRAGFDEKKVHEILVSVGEVLANVIRHGFHQKAGEKGKAKIRVAFADFSDRAEIQIEDDGPSFDPRGVPTPPLPPKKPGGLGIHLIRSLADEVRYEALKPQGNRLQLVIRKGRDGSRTVPGLAG